MAPVPAEELRALLAAKRLREAEELVERGAAHPDRARWFRDAGLLALKSGEPRLAAEWLDRAAQLSPRDPEPRHERGLALLELGEVGLAAHAQAEALALDPEHTGARAQRAAALEALGDDQGAASELAVLLTSLGPQPALHARLAGLRDAARRAAQVSLLGAPAARVQHSPLVAGAFARTAQLPPGLAFRAPFADLEAVPDAHGRLRRLTLVFDSMDASLARTDLSYGGTTEDEHGRRVPLDEFTAASTVFLAQGLGIDAQRARRLLRFLLAPQCGLGPLPFAHASVGWVIDESPGSRRYGLFVEEGRFPAAAT
jgi:tetratricopeptide (TPR) repeat protein